MGFLTWVKDDWAGVTRWAEEGWSVDDRFALTRLVMYDSGSVFQVERSNDVLRSNEIDQLHHSWKTHSSNCTISHMGPLLAVRRARHGRVPILGSVLR